MVKPKNVPKEQISEEAKCFVSGVPATDLEKKIFDFPTFKKDGSREGPYGKNPYVVLKYFQPDWECFSHWEKAELSQLSNFIRSFSQHTWDSVYKTAGKPGNKTGLGYTPYHISEMKAGEDVLKRIRERVSEDISFFELRVSQKIRVHGFQSQSAFFLVLLDREHRVFPD